MKSSPIAPLGAALLISAATAVLAEQVVISEIHYHPSGTAPEYVEIQNLTATVFDIAEWRFVDGIDYTFPPFDEGNTDRTFLGAFERIVIAGVDEATLRAAYTIPAGVKVYGPWTGSLSNAGERLQLDDKNGVRMAEVEYNDDGRKWPIAPDGTGHSLVLAKPNFGASDWRNWKASDSPGGTPGLPESGDEGSSFPDPGVDLSELAIVDLGDVWRYDESGADLGTAWKEVGYDDTGWAEGPGIFGRENETRLAQMPAPGRQTPLATGVVTYYLRKEFQWNAGVANALLTLDAVLDDGLAIYLNGVELGRHRLAAGADYLTGATSVPSGLEAMIEEGIVVADVSGVLVSGTNVLAIELHNSSAGSSDVILGTRIKLAASGGVATINEVRPAAGAAGFVEFYNPTASDIELGGYYISDDPGDLTKHQIPAPLNLPAGGFATVGYESSGLAVDATATVYLTHSDGTSVVDAIDTSLSPGGPSLGRQPAGASDWFLFDAPTPGSDNIVSGDVAGLVTLSEVHFDDDGGIDWVELASTTPGGVPLDGLALASALDFSDAVPISGSIAGGGYASFDVAFPAEANGDVRVFLISGGTVLAEGKFDRGDDLTLESAQSEPVGKEWFYGAGHTRDMANTPERQTDIVINEIMYDTPSDEVDAEFVELYNRGAGPVDLGGWRFVDGIGYEFPPGTTLAAGDFLVVGKNPSWLASVYGGLAALGPFSGGLRDGGELLRLEDARGNLADEVDYRPEGDWPHLADGDGSSMELRHPSMDNSRPSSWADSDESERSQMQTFTYTDTYQTVGLSWPEAGGDLHLHLVGDSHVIIENIRLQLNGGGANLINNPTVKSPTGSSLPGWVIQGTHWRSYLENGSIHLIADGHGDNKVNRAKVNIDNLSPNQSYTLTFDARWVSGKHRLIAQTKDHGFGTSFKLPVPNNLGTPGQPNSQLMGSLAPALGYVRHSPAVPDVSEPVKVMAHVSAGAELAAVEVVHRLDSAGGNGAWQRTAMHDDGISAGDVVAGDGVYTATLNQYGSQGNIVQFYVEATSGDGAASVIPRRGQYGLASNGTPTEHDRPAMWIVDGREMPDTLLQERFIISQHDRNALNAGSGHSPAYDYDFPRASNHFYNATLIINEEEVLYNAEIRKSGSPFTREQGSGLVHGKWKLPGDRLFRERRRSVFDPSGASVTPRYYDDRIARYFLYQLGHPINEMEFVHWVVNGDPFRLRENHEPMSNDFLNRVWEEGSSGTLLRIDDEWRFNDGNSRDGSRNATWAYKSSDNPVRYHSEWLMRTRENDYDYGNFVEFVRAVGTNSFNEESISRMADIDMLTLNAAVRGYDADWDTITLDRGKNAYFYRPRDTGRWMLLHWDGDRVFDRTGQAILGGLTGIPTFFNKPYVRRKMNYYLNKLLDEHTRGSARTEAWMQAEKAAIAGTGIIMTDGHYRNWFSSRESTARNFIGAPRTTAFNITTSGGTTSATAITVEGTAPSTVYDVRVQGQPGAVSSWDDLTGWNLENVVLEMGANLITVEGVDHEGVVVETDTLSINKTGAAPPVVVVATNPASRNVAVSDSVILDASASFDPDGGALTYVWGVSPSIDATLVGVGAAATVGFNKPGLYSVTVTATDSDGDSDSATVELAVYGGTGFSKFSSDALEPFWEPHDLALENGSPTGATYSLNTYDGRLHLFVPGDRPYPLGVPPGERSTLRYVDLGDPWAYRDDDVDLMSVFADPDYDDAAWPIGGGLFGDDGTSVIPAPGINTPLDENIDGHVTYYFRKEFEFGADPEGSLITLRGVLDDGVRIWLNGQLLHSENMPLGTITHTTVSDGSYSPERTLVDFDSYEGTGLLQPGTNVLAADLHNQSAGSSDIMFGLEMDIDANALLGGGSLDGTTHPWLRRQPPATGDWTLQTDLELSGIQFGDFMAGLLVEVDDGGTRSRYAIGYRDGDQIAVSSVSPVGSASTVATTGYAASEHAVVRIERIGNELVFSWRPADVFVEVARVALAAGTEAVFGGPFASTEAAEELNVLFDYVMLVDPNSTSPQSGELVITEVMYKPEGGSAYEYLELYNAGGSAIPLQGYRFPQGEPFDEFVFGDVTIGPGAYLLVVNDLVAFRSRYGNGLDPMIAGEWAGGDLSNGGETITVLDDDDLVVLSFDYDDSPPWPTSPDTDGTSLTLADPATGNTGNGADWVASALAGGSPGRADSSGAFVDWMAARGETNPLATKPGEAVNNLLTYAFGVDLAGGNLEVSLPAVGVIAVGEFDHLTLEYRKRQSDPDVGYDVQSSIDGVNWTPVGHPVEISTTDEGDGTDRVKLRLLEPIAGGGDTLVRVMVTAP